MGSSPTVVIFINANYLDFLHFQQLRATIRELDKTKNQIREEDLAAFESKIAPVKKQAIEAIRCFGDLEKSLVQKMANKENTHGKIFPSCLNIHME